MKNNELAKVAIEARNLSYSPYSKFKVGAALLCKDGKVFKGANVENSSYPLCMCAERNALYSAMMNGYKKEDFVALAISAETLDRIVEMLKQGYSNRDIADTLDISVENVYQVRIAKSRRYRKLYEAVGGWPRTYRRFKNRK